MITTLFLSLVLAGESPLALDLSGWVSHALRNSPAVAEAEASLEGSRASVKSAESFIWPTLAFSASSGYAWASTPPEGHGHTGSESWSASLGLSQELLGSGGRNWLLLRAERRGFEAAEEDYRAAVLEIVMSVLESYYAVVEAEGLRAAAEQSLERSVSQLARARTLYEIGGMTTLELLQLQVQESRDRLSLTRSTQSLNTSYNALYQAAGVSMSSRDMTVDTAAVLTPIPPDFLDGLPQDLDDNPSLRAARLRSEQAFIASRAQGRLAWPSLSANANWGFSDNHFDGFDQVLENDTWSVGIRLNWTIFDGFAREAAARTARAGALRSEASLTSVESGLQSRLLAARENVVVAYEGFVLSELALRQAEEQYRLSKLTYEMGGLSLLDLLDAQQTLTEAQAALVSSRVNSLVEEAGLLVLMGRTPRLGE